MSPFHLTICLNLEGEQTLVLRMEGFAVLSTYPAGQCGGHCNHGCACQRLLGDNRRVCYSERMAGNAAIPDESCERVSDTGDLYGAGSTLTNVSVRDCSKTCHLTPTCRGFTFHVRFRILHRTQRAQWRIELMGRVGDGIERGEGSLIQSPFKHISG